MLKNADILYKLKPIWPHCTGCSSTQEKAIHQYLAPEESTKFALHIDVQIIDQNVFEVKNFNIKD